MKGTRVGVRVLGLICLLVFGGCNGTTGTVAESDAQIKQLKAALEETQQEKSQLQSDAQRLEESLHEAESRLADAKQSNNQLRSQTQELTASRRELEAKVGDLDKARMALEGRVNELSAARGQLQKRVEDLVKSRDDLQTMVDSLMDTRGLLEKQVATLSKARTAALEDAKTAQTRVDQLNDKLKAQTQQMIELQEQMTTIRSVLQQLQQKLE